ncbi:hypothetical protein WM30_24580 [Burkholderia ubonensis]|nr:hypothetical protein WM30_24580 [Burkholderia ubonensis]
MSREELFEIRIFLSNLELIEPVAVKPLKFLKWIFCNIIYTGLGLRIMELLVEYVTHKEHGEPRLSAPIQFKNGPKNFANGWSIAKTGILNVLNWIGIKNNRL